MTLARTWSRRVAPLKVRALPVPAAVLAAAALFGCENGARLTGPTSGGPITDPGTVLTEPTVAHPAFLSPIYPTPFNLKVMRIAGDPATTITMTGGGSGTWGQLGALVLSSIKRDVAVKDTGAMIPGHGGLLDRFDSLVLVPPAVFHFLSLLLGPVGGPAKRLLTGGP